MNATTNACRVLFALAAPVALVACGETLLQATENVEPPVMLSSGGTAGADASPTGGATNSSGGVGDPVSPSSGGGLPFAAEPFFLADDFEQELTWDMHLTDGAAIDRVTEKSRSGEHSIRFTQGSQTSEAYIKLPIEPRETGDRLYVRAWYYIPSGAVNGRVNLVSSNGVTAPDVNLLPMGVVEIFLHPGEVRVSSAPGIYAEDRWFCLETGLLVHPEQGELSVSIAGENVLSVRGEDTTTEPFEYAVVGLTWVEMEQENGVIYVDDLAVDYLPLPCD